MKCGVFIAFLCFIGLLADAQTDSLMVGSLNRDCVLIVEGEMNQIMVPIEVSVKNEDYGRYDTSEEFHRFISWQSVNEDGNLTNDFLTTDNWSQNWKFWFNSTDIVTWTRLMNMQDNCPTTSFMLYRGKEPVATASVAKSPLNSLCRPHHGTITNAEDGVVIEGRFDSLYDCAANAVELRGQPSAVQYNNNVCEAFYGSSPKLVSFLISHDTSLACILQCNKFPSTGPAGAGRVLKKENFDMCEQAGKGQSAHSVSYNSRDNTCRLYDIESRLIIGNDDAVAGCYITNP